MSKDTLLAVAAFAATLVLGTGCQSYTVPGRAADLSQFALDGQGDSRAAQTLGVEELLARQPMASFPTTLAVVRVQAPGYGRNPWGNSSGQVTTFGDGAFTVVTSRGPGEEEALQRLTKLPQVASVAAVNGLLVPARLDSELDLRRIGAQLHSDLMLFYTLDTTAETHQRWTFVNVVAGIASLGLLTRQDTRLAATAAAILVDTRTGYVYGTAESTARREPAHSLYGADDELEKERLKVEGEALAHLSENLERTWTGVLAAYGPGAEDPDVRPSQ